MTTEMEAHRQQIQKYLNDTYGLLAQAERKLAVTANLQERINLRTKINEYESYLEKWQEELTKLTAEDATKTEPLTEALNPTATQAYLFNMARKAYGLGMYGEARDFASSLREQNATYPGLETLEDDIAAATGKPATPRYNNTKAATSNNFGLQFLIVGGLLVFVIALMIILLVTQPSNQARGNNNQARPGNGAAATATRVIVLPPAPTQAPFLVATPTVGANIPTPAVTSGVVLGPSPTPTATARPPQPTPTAKK